MLDGPTDALERRVERLEREVREARLELVEQEAQILALEVRVSQVAMWLGHRPERYQ